MVREIIERIRRAEEEAGEIVSAARAEAARLEQEPEGGREALREELMGRAKAELESFEESESRRREEKIAAVASESERRLEEVSRLASGREKESTALLAELILEDFS